MVGSEEQLRKVFTGSYKDMAMSVTHLDEGTEVLTLPDARHLWLSVASLWPLLVSHRKEYFRDKEL